MRRSSTGWCASFFLLFEPDFGRKRASLRKLKREPLLLPAVNGEPHKLKCECKRLERISAMQVGDIGIEPSHGNWAGRFITRNRVWTTDCNVNGLRVARRRLHVDLGLCNRVFHLCTALASLWIATSNPRVQAGVGIIILSTWCAHSKKVILPSGSQMSKRGSKVQSKGRWSLGHRPTR